MFYAMLVAGAAHAQNDVAAALEMVERNSARLKSAAAQLEYDRISNSSVRSLEDPEFGFDYLWGQGADGGIRRDFNVSQSFDVATLVGAKRRLAGSMDDMALTRYEAERMAVLSEARRLCSDIVCCNALMSALEEYQGDISTLYDMTSRRVELGDAAALDLSKVRLQLSTIRSRLSRLKAERMSYLSALRSLAGDQDLELDSVEYPSSGVLPDFDEWLSVAMSSDPDLRYGVSEIESGRMQLKIDRMSWIPDFSVGYMAELGPSERYRGMTFGVSIPLWSNMRKVKASAAALRLYSAQAEAQKQSVRNGLVKTWQEAAALQAAAAESRAALEEADPRALLSKSVEKGAVSMLDCILELGMYYDALEQTLLDERDWRSAWIEVQKYYL